MGNLTWLVYWLPALAIALVLAWLLHPLFERQRWFERQLRWRKPLDDDEYYRRFFSGRGTPRDVPIRLRRVYAGALGYPPKVLLPTDSFVWIWQDRRGTELLQAVEAEFAVTISAEDREGLDGSMYTVADLLTRLWQAPNRDADQ